MQPAQIGIHCHHSVRIFVQEVSGDNSACVLIGAPFRWGRSLIAAQGRPDLVGHACVCFDIQRA
ncbi:MAG: hypothetical protein KDD75_07660, partial [Caldilineaceae bacterium]|nr:hypothetical protein [Caldilineaceae bacterium]